MQRLGADKVTVAFEGLTLLNEVDLEVSPGQIVGLIGPNGAGKTTLVNVLSGLKPHQIRRQGVAGTFQGGRLFRDLPVIDNLEVTGIGLGQSGLAAIAEAERILDWVGIAPLADRIAGTLP